MTGKPNDHPMPARNDDGSIGDADYNATHRPDDAPPTPPPAVKAWPDLTPNQEAARRAASPPPRPWHTCPTCRTPRTLTRQMAARGYQCDRCADLEEGAW